jgi:hypothetical protein
LTAPARHAPAIERVSTLELFFDLVFVFTITQLTAVLAHHPTWEGLAQVVLMLGVIWWMYGGYAWLTNTVRADIGIVRLLLLGGMAGFMVLALVIPTTFSGDGPLFGLAYLLVVAIHSGLFLRASPASVAASFRGVVPYNLAMSALVIVGGAIGGTVEYVLFAAAFAVGWFLPKGNDESGFEIGPAHFVERHGLVVIVAIGESVIAVGIGASQLEVDAGMIAVAVLGLALSACFWWTYFGGDDTRAEWRSLTLRTSSPSRGPSLSAAGSPRTCSARRCSGASSASARRGPGCWSPAWPSRRSRSAPSSRRSSRSRSWSSLRRPRSRSSARRAGPRRLRDQASSRPFLREERQVGARAARGKRRRARRSASR